MNSESSQHDRQARRAAAGFNSTTHESGRLFQLSDEIQVELTLHLDVKAVFTPPLQGQSVLMR